MKSFSLHTVAAIFASLAGTAFSQGKMPVAIGAIENEAGATKANLQQLANMRERLESAIVNTRKFQVVERDKIGQLLKEQRLADVGITDENDPNAPASGKAKCAGYMIYGTILFMGEDHTVTATAASRDLESTHKVELLVKLTDVETSEILAEKTVVGHGTRTAHADANSATGTDRFSGDHSLSLACQDAATKIATMLLELAFPSKVMEVDGTTLTINVAKELCELGQVWEVISEGEEKFDPDTGESLGSSEKVLGRVKIVRQGPKMSQAEPYGDAGFMEKVSTGMLARRVDPDLLAREAAAAREQAHARQKADDAATTSRLSGGKKLYVAITDIENEAGATKANLQQLKNVKDRIQDAIVNTRKFSVVERDSIKTILKEQNLQAHSGVVDKNDPNAVRQGSVRAVGYVIYGKILFMGADKKETEGFLSSKKEYSHRVEIQVKMTDAESGDILFSRKVVGRGIREEKQTFTTKSGANDPFSGDHTLSLACDDAAKKIAAALLEAAFPAKIMNIADDIITVSVPGEMTSVGELFEVVKTGDEMIDEDTGESLGRTETVLGRIRIDRVQEKFSQGKAVEPAKAEQFAKGMLVRRINDAILETERKEQARIKSEQDQQQKKQQLVGFLDKVDVEVPGVNDGAPPVATQEKPASPPQQPEPSAPATAATTDEIKAEADALKEANAKTEEQMLAEDGAAKEDHERRLAEEKRLAEEVERQRQIARLNRPMFTTLDWPTCYVSRREYVAIATNDAIAYFIASVDNESDAADSDVAALDFAFLDLLSHSLAFGGFEKWVYNDALKGQMDGKKVVELKRDDGEDAFVLCRFPLKRVGVYPKIVGFSREKDTTTHGNTQWKSETTNFEVEMRFVDLVAGETISTVTVEGHGMMTAEGERGTVRFTNVLSSKNQFVKEGSSLADACADISYEMVWAAINQNFAGRITSVGKKAATMDFTDNLVKEKDVFDVFAEDANPNEDEPVGRVVVVEAGRKASKVEPYKNTCSLGDIEEGMRIRKVSRYTLRNERGVRNKKRARD